jgi:YesN/AraC family two-component response regulator
LGEKVLAEANLVWVDFRQVCESSVVERLGEKFALARVRHIGEIRVLIAEKRWDFLIFDYDFPDLPRLKALQQIKSDYPHLPILMLTKRHSESLAVWAFRSGVRDYIVKPVREADLIRSCVNLRSVKSRGVERRRENLMPKPSVPRNARIDCTPRSVSGLGRALEYLHSHFHERVSLDMVASLCALNRFEFSRAFRNHFGITFREYLLQYRIRKAIGMLENPNVRIADVAYLVGFNDLSHFSRVFRKYIGMTPSEHRKRANASSTKAAAALACLPRVL